MKHTDQSLRQAADHLLQLAEWGMALCCAVFVCRWLAIGALVLSIMGAVAPRVGLVALYGYAVALATLYGFDVYLRAHTRRIEREAAEYFWRRRP